MRLRVIVLGMVVATWGCGPSAPPAKTGAKPATAPTPAAKPTFADVGFDLSRSSALGTNAGYSIELPPGWLGTPVEEASAEAFLARVRQVSESTANGVSQILANQRQNGGVMMAFDARRETIRQGFASNVLSWAAPWTGDKGVETRFEAARKEADRLLDGITVAKTAHRAPWGAVTLYTVAGTARQGTSTVPIRELHFFWRKGERLHHARFQSHGDLIAQNKPVFVKMIDGLSWNR